MKNPLPLYFLIGCLALYSAAMTRRIFRLQDDLEQNTAALNQLLDTQLKIDRHIEVALTRIDHDAVMKDSPEYLRLRRGTP